MDSVFQDIRYAVRRLSATPGFAAMAVLTLALGLGATTAIFGALNATLLRPLPYPDADRLVFVWGHRETAPTPQLPVSLPVALDIRERSRSFAAVETWTSLADTRFSLTTGGDPQDVQYAVVSAGLFPLLGARTVRGRLFGAADDRLGAPGVAIISHRLWQTRFGASDDLVGRAIALDGTPYAVIGVLDERFRFVEYPRAPDVWLPLGSDPFRDRRFAPVATMGVAAKLRPAVSLDAARRELAQLAATIGREFPPLRNWTLVAQSFRTQLTGTRRPLLVSLGGAVGLVLLIACANVAALLLVRAAGRDREMAVRAALGASRPRLIGLLLAESLVLALAAGGLGLLVSAWATDVIALLAAGDRSPFVPWRTLAGDLRPDLATFAFAFTAAVASGIVAGLVPAWQATGSRFTAALGAAARGVIERHRVRAALVALQITLSLTLLTSAGLLARSFSALAAVDPGFVPSRAVAVELALPSGPYARPERVIGFYDALLARLRDMPDIEAAGASDRVPLGDVPPSTDIRLEGDAAPEPGLEPRAEYSTVTPGWFAAAGVRVLRGRAFTDADSATAPRVVVINEALAHAYSAGRDPLGRRLALSNESLRFLARDRPPVVDFASAYRDVIGVVADVRSALDAQARPAVYVPLAQRPERQMSVTVRAAVPAARLVETVRLAVRELDPLQSIGRARTLDEVVAAEAGDARFRAQLTGVLAAIALALAAIGVYGVVSHGVARRTREIGLRIALGATTADVVRLSARDGLRPALLGTAAGLPGALLAASAIRGLLFGVPPFDVATFAAAMTLLLGASAVASWLPARRAMRIDPSEALKTE